MMNPFTRRQFMGTLGTGMALSSLPRLGAAGEQSQKPNVLLILVDDLGKEWIGCYGAEGIETPNIDALAKDGIQFRNAYSMPQCTPTRVTLLTGRYPWRTGWVNHWDVPRWGVGYFDWKHNLCVARTLRQAGYKTAAAGKWQINDFRLEPQVMDKHGFDDWCLWTGYETGVPASAERYWDPYVNTPEGSRTLTGRFGADVFTNRLIDFMKTHRRDPMFLYFPMALTHGPLTHTPDHPNASGKMERFRAMVQYTDVCVGRLVNTLDTLGIRDRTIIIFTTDNGTDRSIEGKRNGMRVQGGKAKKTENGICAPFIVNCPGLVPQGLVSDELTDFTDLAPTFAELAGTKMPDEIEIDGVSIAPFLLGKTNETKRDWILAMGHGPAVRDEEGIRGVHPYASRVIRDKRFKVWVNEQRRIDQLFDLIEDPLEKNNLISSADPNHKKAIQKFQAVVDTIPTNDARPKYDQRAPNPWDKKLDV